MDIGELDGETVALDVLLPESDGMSYGLYQLVTGALFESKEIQRRARLDVVGNTASLINRLRIERQNRDGGMAPPPQAPEFGDFYPVFAAEGQSLAEGEGS